MGCVVTVLWSSVCLNPLVINSRQPFASMDVLFLSGGWPHACFNRITSLITVFITVERCLCVTIPLQVKSIISPFRTKVIISTIFATMLILFSPFYFVNRLEWRYQPRWNLLVLSIVFTEHRNLVDTITFCIHSVAISILSLSSVCVCSMILILHLNRNSQWRQLTAGRCVDATSKKDRRVVKMVSLISSIYVACYLPSTVIFFMMVYNSELKFGARYENTTVVIWVISFLLETINSSVNILVYWHTSSRFKGHLLGLCCPARPTLAS